MTAAIYYGLAGIVLFLTGLYTVITAPHMIRKILALNIMGSGVFLFFIATAFRGIDISPDPVPHALVLTGLVVSISATALGLWLTVESQRTGQHDARR